MKRFSNLLLSTILVSISVTAIAQSTNIRQTANTTEATPYKVTMTNIKIGKEDYSKIILNAWLAYDNNQVEAIAPIIADTITARLPDGTMLKGKSNFIDAMTAYRGSFFSVVSKVDAVTTLKADNFGNVEVTAIWGLETAT